MVSIFLISSTFQQQHLCRTNPELRHEINVADPSNCHLFLRCEYNRTDEVHKVIVRSCMEATNALTFLDQGNGYHICSYGSSHCEKQIACPPVGQPDIMVSQKNYFRL